MSFARKYYHSIAKSYPSLSPTASHFKASCPSRHLLISRLTLMAIDTSKRFAYGFAISLIAADQISQTRPSPPPGALADSRQ